MTEPQTIDLFYEAADYDTVARLLDQMTPQQLWAIYQLIPGRVQDADHPPVTVSFDDDGILLTCPHCQATSREEDGYYLVDHETRWRPYRIATPDGALDFHVGEGTPDPETLTDMCQACCRPVTFPEATNYHWW